MMQITEFQKIMAFISAAIEKKIKEATIEVYYDMLKDLDYALVMAAVKKVVASDEYPTLPTVGKIRKAAYDLCNMNRVSAPEAWGLVVRETRRHGYYSEAEALASMPPAVAETCKFIGWRDLCLSEKPDVVRAQFMRMYEAHEKRKEEMGLLPADVRELVGKLGDGMKMIGKGTG